MAVDLIAGIAPFFTGLGSLSTPIAIILLVVIVLVYFTKNIKNFNTFFKLIFKGKKRSCSDCIMMVLTNSEAYWNNSKRIQDSILPAQMLLVNQMIDKFSSEKMEIVSNILAKSKLSPEEQTKELLLCKFLLIFALDSFTKLEMRRAFRQNHLNEMTELEFKSYIDKEFSIVKSQLKMHVSNFYQQSMEIPLSEIFELLKLETEFKNDIENCFINARTIKIEAVEEIAKLKKVYDDFNKSLYK
jgi:hypothetical protein